MTDDHLGRWPLELLQNAEDALAPEVLVRVTDTAVYVADKGKGLSPEAVQSLSGTFLSDKREGIGRKGVGFKAVYEITSSPCVFTGADDGVSFDPGRAQDWMRGHDVEAPSGKVPYQWLPFWVSRKQAEQDDLDLQALDEYPTVVRLPFDRATTVDPAVAEIQSLTPLVLLTFSHVRRLHVDTPVGAFEIKAQAEANRHGIWVLHDTRMAAPVRWRVARWEEDTPAGLLKDLDDDERERAKRSSYLVAVPVDDEGVVRPAEDFLPLYVYYATEQLCPCRILMHADFVVSSDRKAVIDPAKNAFNKWIAERLVDHVIEFVNRTYDRSRPSASIGLLRPHRHLTEDTTVSARLAQALHGPVHSPQLAEHAMARALWDSLAQRAKKRLRIPDIKGKPRLEFEKAQMVSTSIARDEARSILAATPEGARLVHKDFDENDDAAAALRALGCAHVGDDELLKCLAAHAPSRARDPGWLMACWRWFAAWVSAKQTWDDEHKRRLEKVRGLPVLPVGGRCTAISSHKDYIVTWRDRSSETEIPKWLPIMFVDNRFRDGILGLPEDGPVRTLLKELGVNPPEQNVLLQAFGKAVAVYWKKPDKQPGRFLDFLLERDWHETLDPIPQAQRCPVLADVQGRPEAQWVKADSAYFGRAWAQGPIADVYEGVRGVAWVRPRKSADKDVLRNILEWLGVQACPRVLQDDSREAVEAEEARVRPLVNYNRVLKVKVLHLDGVNLGGLSPPQSEALLTLLALNWEDYYGSRSTIIVEYTPRSVSKYTTVPAAWWHKVKSEWTPPLERNWGAPAAVEKCWLPDRETRDAIGDLLPTIDLARVDAHRRQVEKWLREVVGVRSRLDQVTVDEWRFLLKEQIPAVIAERNLSADQKGRALVQPWYEAALYSLDRQESDVRLSDVPLLCRKGDEWRLVPPAEKRWLDMDPEWSELFEADVWQITFAKQLLGRAEKTFGLLPLSEPHLQVEPWPLDSEQDCPDLQKALDSAKPYVFAQRCYETKSVQPVELRTQLKNLAVRLAGRMGVSATLAGHTREKELDYRSDYSRLILRTGKEDLPHLALALAACLKVRSEADFYENLLRCGSDAESEKKLAARGIPGGQIMRWIHEYAEGRQPLEPRQESGQDTATPPHEPPPPPPGPGEGKKPNGRKDEQKQPESSLPPPQPRSLKDGQTCDYTIGTSAPQPSSTAGGGEEHAGTDQSSAETSRGPPSDAERREIEEQARCLAERALQERGYVVTAMPYENPGYDLKATKANDVLLVEVKGHLGKARKVDLTVRQLAEHNECAMEGSGKRWALCNAENLAGDADEARVTFYVGIPKDALEDRSFAVDLSKCSVGEV